MNSYRFDHADGIVVSTAITAGGYESNHAEAIVVSTPITAGGNWGQNHAEGIVLTTPIGAAGVMSRRAGCCVIRRPGSAPLEV